LAARPKDPPNKSHPWSTKLMNEATEQNEGSALPLLAAADLQDHLMTATNDLERRIPCYRDA
jgi:cellobiose-specific phosphotransferase system component IIA